MRYAGGKGREGIFQLIVNEMPPHDIYCEPFIGGASVMLAKRPALINVGYDKAIAAVASARAAFCDKRSLAPLAHRYTKTLGHIFGHFGEPFDQFVFSTWDERPAQADYRFRCGDALSLLRRADFLRANGRLIVGGARTRMKGALLYVDPPYLIETRKMKRAIYEHEFDDWQHIELLKLLRSLRGARVMISGYRSNIYEDILHDWRVVKFENTTRGRGKVTEYLWCNFPKATELHDYSYIGIGFRQRELIRKMQRNFLGKLKRMNPIERRAIMIEALKGMIDL